MSHFTLMVVAEDETQLEELLAPYDESLQVEPYKSYDDLAWVKNEEFNSLTTPEEKISWIKENWEEDYFWDSEENSFYTMSTYNPESKWDWWTLGGRWMGYFPLKAGATTGQLGSPGAFGNAAEPNKVDLAAIKDIDFDRMRNEAAQRAEDAYNEWESFVAVNGTPDRWEGGQKDIDYKEYRKNFFSKEVNLLANKKWFGDWSDFLDMDRETYVANAVKNAVPCFAFLDKTNGWIEKGSMGWFGISTATDESTDTYLDMVNAILDGLNPEVKIACVDCHI